MLESSGWSEHHIRGSLVDMGHQVTGFTYGPVVGEFYGRAKAGERENKNLELLHLAQKMSTGEGLDLIFCYVYDDYLMPQYARALAELGVPMVNYNVDMVNQWYRQIRTAKYFSRLLCAQRKNMDNLARYGAKVMYFPMAARRSLFDGEFDKAFQPEAPVTFLGTPMPFRTRVLSRIVDAGLPLAVYGKFWQENRQACPIRNLEKTFSDILQYGYARARAEGVKSLFHALADRVHPIAQSGESGLPQALIHGFLPEEKLSSLFHQSRINLGFTRMQGDNPENPGVNQVKLRDFEVPLAGGFYLVENAPGYDELFKLGVEVETWSTPEELLEKIKYYLVNDDKRDQIARAGQARARAEHTWEHRFSTLFAELGLQ